MKRKWWMLLVGVIVAVVCGFVAYFFLFGLFEPPVDTSGINLSSDFTTEGLLPTQLVGISLNEEKVITYPIVGSRNFVEFNVSRTIATYDGIVLEIMKADNEDEATLVFEVTFDMEDYFGDASGFMHKTKAPWWFTYESEGISGFYWKSGIWVFGVEAVNGEIRNQAAEEFVLALRGY
ncbi:hypothetical protein E2P60_01440 [Candidatus Bathyarchaeota archaeon]|nr:hypothetical protein E2P60_01440 [Candidatus Bathyarchaeota archaeon]